MDGSRPQLQELPSSPRPSPQLPDLASLAIKLNPEWTPNPPASQPARPRPDYSPTELDIERRAIEYLADCDPSIQGSNGSRAALWAARAVCYGFDLGEARGLDLLLEHFNPRCLPPWTEAELRKKCQDANTAAGFSKPRGFLLHAENAYTHRAATSNDSAIAGLLSPPTPAATLQAGQGKGIAAELNPAPTPATQQTPPQPAEPASLIGVSPDDPCHLARLFLAQPRYTHAEGRRLRYWDSQFAEWKDGAFDRLKDENLTGDLLEFIEAEFIRLHAHAAAVEDDNYTKGGAPAGKSKQPTKHKVSTGLISNVKQALQAYTRIPADLSPPCWAYGDGPAPSASIAARNGVLDLAAHVSEDPGAFIPATPRFLTLNRTSFDYDPNAGRPAGWLAFLNSLWPNDPDSIKCLQEWFGYLLTPDTSLQKMLMLIGPPRAGKGTIGRILKLLIGERNIAAPTLASLADQFGLCDLLDKTVAIIADARLSGRADSVAVTEQLLCISGEDPRTINRKFLSPTVANLRTRFVFFSNELPRFGDSSAAIVSRLVILRLTETFIGREDTGLLDRLTPELPGILLWAIKGWDRLRLTRRFTAPSSAAELIEDAENLASPVKLWVSEDCELTDDAETATTELYRSWCEWCKRHGRDKPGSQELLVRDLRAAFPNLKKTRLGGKARRYYCYSGIRTLSAMERGEIEI